MPLGEIVDALTPPFELLLAVTILNVLLFVPLGAALALRGVSVGRTVLAAVALSASVELAQLLVVSGRTTSVDDVLLNTAGAWLGHAVLSAWTSLGDGWSAFGSRCSSRPPRCRPGSPRSSRGSKRRRPSRSASMPLARAGARGRGSRLCWRCTSESTGGSSAATRTRSSPSRSRCSRRRRASTDTTSSSTSSRATPESRAAGVRFGVWALTHDLDERPPLERMSLRAPPGTRVYRMQIDALLGDGRRVAVHTSYGALDPTSLHRTRNQALWKAESAFAHRLETVRRLGERYLATRPAAKAETLPRLSNRAVARRAAASALGVLSRRARALREREAWFVAARPFREPEPEASGFGATDGFEPLELSARGRRRPVCAPERGTRPTSSSRTTTLEPVGATSRTRASTPTAGWRASRRRRSRAHTTCPTRSSSVTRVRSS